MQRIVQVVSCCVFLAGCGSDLAKPKLPYEPDATTLIGGFDNPDELLALRVETTPDGDACIDLDGSCVKPQETCGDDGAADVLIDDQGEVVDVICYPTEGVSVETFEGEIDDVGNDVVLVFDGEDDGSDVVGDLTIDGNNVTLYGQGPEVSVLEGDLTIEKNNAVVRGITVQGDVTITKNNPSIVDCVIEGDLTIRSNNVSIALCEVRGELIIEGNNTVLLGNRLAKAPVVRGNNTVCSDNLSLGEPGEPIECATKAE